MKYSLYILIFFLFSCSKQPPIRELVANQHIGKGVMHNDPCKTLYRDDGNEVKMPKDFKLKPHEAVIIAKQKLGYSCINKLGAQLFADSSNYYLVRLGVTDNAIIIDGTNGAIISKGFMGESK